MCDGSLDRTIWIDWENKVISFKCVDGFEPKAFSSPEEKLNYAMDKCSVGFRIQ